MDLDKETGFETKLQPENRLFDRGKGNVSKTIVFETGEEAARVMVS